MVNYPILKIAILGTRGLPANYGGFETFAEEISKQFLKLGHEVTVYGRKKFGEKPDNSDYQGIKRIATSTIYQKYLETPLSSITAYLDALKRDFDVVLICNAANSPFSWILKLNNYPIAINVDGIERRRAKWNALGKLWYLLGEKTSVWFADRIISDAEIIAKYYEDNYHLRTDIIRYGCKPEPINSGKVLQDFCLEEKKYILYVSRLEPENNALGVIQAYNKLETEIPLVIVGDAPYSKEYIENLKAVANSKVIFTGFQFREAYRELRTNCLIYIQATEVGGTHPALVESMAYGNAVIANDVPEHREVLEDVGIYYAFNDFQDLSYKMQELLDSPDKRSDLSKKAKSLAEQNFSWEVIANQYQELFSQIVNTRLY